MKRALALTLLAAAVATTPVLAAPPSKRPICQAPKLPARDAKRPDPCRKLQSIPPVIDQTPMFFLSTGAGPVTVSDLS